MTRLLGVTKCPNVLPTFHSTHCDAKTVLFVIGASAPTDCTPVAHCFADCRCGNLIETLIRTYCATIVKEHASLPTLDLVPVLINEHEQVLFSLIT